MTEKTEVYMKDFWQRMKIWIIIVLVLGLSAFNNLDYLTIWECFVYIFIPRVAGGLIILVIIYFIKYLDKNLNIK